MIARGDGEEAQEKDGLDRSFAPVPQSCFQGAVRLTPAIAVTSLSAAIPSFLLLFPLRGPTSSDYSTGSRARVWVFLYSVCGSFASPSS
jgi:hypothetical protein